MNIFYLTNIFIHIIIKKFLPWYSPRINIMSLRVAADTLTVLEGFKTMYRIIFPFLLSVLLLLTAPGCKKALLIAPESATLVVTVNPAGIPLGGKTTVTVVGYKASGTPLPDGTLIYFSTDIGSIERSKETVSGVAEAEFHSNDNRSGIATLTVTSGNAKTTPEEITITIGNSALDSLTVGVDPSTLPIGGGSSIIRVAAYDATLNPMPNVPLVITTTSGQLASGGATIYTSADGSAQDTLTTQNTAEITVTSGSITINATVTVTDNLLPKPAFTFSPTNPVVGDKVVFNARSSTDDDGEIILYQWDFGDTKKDQGEVVNHKFKSPGTYEVVLTVTDNANNKVSTSRTVTVTQGSAPTARIIYSPDNPGLGDTIYFNAEDSSDPDGEIVSYEWDFGEGSSDSGVKVTHAYHSSGQYRVILKVTDDDDNVGIATLDLDINESDAPTASFTFSPNPVGIDKAVSFDASSSSASGSGNRIVGYQWNFGDGSTGSGEVTTHSYQSEGTYIITLTVTDANNKTDTASDTITVEANSPPTANFVFLPSSPKINQTISFDASSSTDDGEIVSYQWNFGDNTTATGRVTTHQYGTKDTYIVTLTVTDNGGASDTFSRQVDVTKGASPVAKIQHSPTSPHTGDLVSFNGYDSTDSDGEIVSYSWNFGDGSTATGAAVTHTFTPANTYVISLTITDDDGNTDTTTLSLTITDPAPRVGPSGKRGVKR